VSSKDHKLLNQYASSDDELEDLGSNCLSKLATGREHLSAALDSGTDNVLTLIRVRARTSRIAKLLQIPSSQPAHENTAPLPPGWHYSTGHGGYFWSESGDSQWEHPITGLVPSPAKLRDGDDRLTEPLMKLHEETDSTLSWVEQEEEEEGAGQTEPLVKLHGETDSASSYVKQEEEEEEEEGAGQTEPLVKLHGETDSASSCVKQEEEKEEEEGAGQTEPLVKLQETDSDELSRLRRENQVLQEELQIARAQAKQQVWSDATLGEAPLLRSILLSRR